MKFEVGFCSWILILIIFMSTSMVVKNDIGKSCYNSQLESCIIMYFLFSMNLVISKFLDNFQECSSCIHRTFFIFFCIYFPPINVLISCIMIINEQNHCGSFELVRKTSEFPLRCVQILFLMLNTLSPLFYDVGFFNIIYGRYVVNNTTLNEPLLS